MAKVAKGILKVYLLSFNALPFVALGVWVLGGPTHVIVFWWLVPLVPVVIGCLIALWIVAVVDFFSGRGRFED
jgi:hypothetical protein